MYDKLTLQEKQAVEIASCSGDMRGFLYFLKTYAKLVEPPSHTSPGGIIPFQLWPHLLEATKIFFSDILITWLKSRQIGASWLVAAYVLWFSMFKKSATSLLFSRGQAEAIELLGKCKRIHLQLPDFMKEKLDPDSTVSIGLPSMGSTIMAFPSTPSSGVSYTASIVVFDEWSYHEYATDIYTQAKPCIDSSGGQLIGIFTADKKKTAYLAKQTYLGAVEKKNGFTAIFSPYDVRPGRDEAWYQKKLGELTPEELEGLTPQMYMEQNYPRNDREALSVISSVSVISPEVIESMLLDTKPALALDDKTVDYNVVRIYKPFIFGHSYASACDISHGVGKDFSVGIIGDVKTGEIVADIMRNDLPVEVFAEHYYKMLELYRFPLAAPEDNDRGHYVILRLQELNYPNLYYQTVKTKSSGDVEKTRPGWRTGKADRDKAFQILVPALNNRQVTIYNRNAILQLTQLIRNVDKEGRIEAAVGGNDDYAMTLAIWASIKDSVHPAVQNLRIINTCKF